MKNKYFILAITFLCLLLGQSSFAQFEGDGDFEDGQDPCEVGSMYYNPDFCLDTPCVGGGCDPCDPLSANFDPSGCGGSGDGSGDGSSGGGGSTPDPCAIVNCNGDGGGDGDDDGECWWCGDDTGGGGDTGGGNTGGGNTGGGSTGGGSTGGGSTPPPPTNFQIATTIASTAIATGQAFNEVYTTMSDAIFSSTPMTVNTNNLIKNVLDSNSLSMATIKSELALVKKLNGIAILGAAGKVLGVTGVVTSSMALYNDIQDGNGVSLVNVADVAISVGTLFIKSNVVGLAVSGGWLLIKGEFGE